MNKAAFLFLIMIPSISHCSEDEQGLIEELDTVNINIGSVESQTREPIRNSAFRRSRKIATSFLFLALVPLVIGLGIDIHTAETYSTEFRQVATAFPLNATDAQLQQYSCQHYSCFCDYSTQCVCCSPIFPYFDNGEECRNLLYTSDDQYYRQRGVIVKQCTEEVTNNIPEITSWVSIGCRFVNVCLASVIYDRLRK